MSTVAAEKTIQAPPAEAITQPPTVVERIQRQRETIVVESPIPVLDTAMFEHMQRIAKMMASSSLVPAHLNSVRKVGGQEVVIEPQEAVANCFLVTNQAIRWRMDPFAVAQHTYVTKGRVGYEGKMIAAVINTHPAIEKRLSYAYEGQGKDRKVTVTAKLKGDTEPRSIEGRVKDWETTGSGSPWGNANQWDQMLSYRGAREWARRWLPEAVLGVWGDDEIEQFAATEGRVAGAATQAEPTARGAAGLKQALKAGAAAATDAQIVDDKKDAPATNAVAQGTDAKAVAAEKSAPDGTAPAPAAPEPKQTEEPTDLSDKWRASKPGKRTQEPKAKLASTRELRDKYIAKFKDCKDTEILALVRDEVNLYQWTDADREAIDVAYSKRQDELEAGK